MLEIMIYFLLFVLSLASYIQMYRSSMPWEKIGIRSVGWLFLCPPAFGVATLVVIYQKLGGEINFFVVFFIFSSLFFGSFFMVDRFKKAKHKSTR